MIWKNQRVRKITRGVLEKFGLIEVFFDIYTWYQNIRPLENINQVYNPEYIKNHGYCGDRDLQTKGFHAREIARLLSPQKVLVAGCAEGNAVRAFHDLDIEAWGFDIIPSILEDNDPLRKFLKIGSMSSIPFSSADNFDVFVCTDVFEHIYLKDIPIMIDEIYRLGVDWLALIISHDSISLGHVTLKSLKWYKKQFEGKYQLIPETKTMCYPGVYGLDPDVSRSRFSFWKRTG